MTTDRLLIEIFQQQQKMMKQIKKIQTIHTKTNINLNEKEVSQKNAVQTWK